MRTTLNVRAVTGRIPLGVAVDGPLASRAAAELNVFGAPHAQQKRGVLTARFSGGRSSVSGIVATVFGSTGFLGRYVVNGLGRIGSQIVVTYRGDDECIRHLKVMGDLGQIVPLPIDVRDPASLERAVSRSNVVINLIGKDYETRNFNFDDVNVKTAKLIAEVSKSVGVERLIHVSALAVGKDKLSRWAATKAAGEEVVREAFPGATILRPGVLYGTEDQFLNRVASFAKQMPRQLLIDGGRAKVQPTYVGDVAVAILNALSTPESVGKTYELAGPTIYKLRELYEFVFDEILEDDNTVDVSPAVAKLLGYILQQSPFTPLLTVDQVKRQLVDVVRDPKALSFEDLAVDKQANFSQVAGEYLRRYRKGGLFAKVADQTF